MKHWLLAPRTSAAEPPAVRSVARSHVGRVRQINEDRVFDCPGRRLWAVADGMGGHSGGDLAAQSIVDELRALSDRDGPVAAGDMLAAIRAANQAIVRRNAAQSTDAGSTVVAALIDGDTATIAWVGDSRAYLVRDERLTLLTHDHSVVQDLIDAGLLSPERASRHPHANVVTRALGVGQDVEIDRVVVDLSAGDHLLLCSDGLSRSLQAEDFGARELDAAADALLSRSLGRDGTDNTSFVLIEVSPTR